MSASHRWFASKFQNHAGGMNKASIKFLNPQLCRELCDSLKTSGNDGYFPKRGGGALDFGAVSGNGIRGHLITLRPGKRLSRDGLR